jgi:autotransporter passenger strand-loop-strand repeat protein
MGRHGVEAAVGVEQVMAVFKVSNGTEFVSSGGVAIGTTVFNGGTETKKFSGGTEIVSSGGVTSRTTIEGGKLEIDEGGKAAGLVTFSGGDGELVIDARAMPGATISGFAATDKIVLSAIRFSTSDSVSVNAPGIVTVSAGGKDYNLHIAGATVGETDFSFGAGSILTRGAADQPGFLRPAASAAAEADVWGRRLL